MTPPTLTLGTVALTVSDLGRSVDYYTGSIGLALLGRSEESASLGAAGDELVRLVELRGAQPHPRATGLFHLALRVPDRPSLARWLAHAARTHVPLQGASDHFVSEAIYLGDPDGHGIEVYHDRPRAHWEGQVARMTTQPLDVAGLLDELDDPATASFDGLPAGTDMGHVHLQVRDVPEAVRFYRDVAGLDLMATYGGRAAFLAADGYHHHVGVNTWNSQGSEPPPPGAAALRHVTLVLADDDAVAAVADRAEAAGAAASSADGRVVVEDPSGIRIALRAAA